MTTFSTLAALQWEGLLGRQKILTWPVIHTSFSFFNTFIFFTMARAAANVHLTPCTLELGGKSPTYFDDSGDMEVVTTSPSSSFVLVLIFGTVIVFVGVLPSIIVLLDTMSPDQSEAALVGKVQQLRTNLRRT